MARCVSSDAGFTLVEVLVAFAVLAVTLIAIVGVFGTSFRGIDTAQTKTRALQLAQSRLAMEAVRLRGPVEETTGRFDDQFSWKVRTERHVAPDLMPQHRIGAMWIHIDVSWLTRRGTGTQSVSLSTLKVVPLAQ